MTSPVANHRVVLIYEKENFYPEKPGVLYPAFLWSGALVIPVQYFDGTTAELWFFKAQDLELVPWDKPPILTLN